MSERITEKGHVLAIHVDPAMTDFRGEDGSSPLPMLPSA